MNRLSLVLRQKIISIVFVLIALAGGVFIFWYIGELKEKIPEDSVNNNRVLIAETDMKKGEEVKAGSVKIQEIPSDIFSGKFITDKDEIIGKIVEADILKGEIITEDKIEDMADSGGISLGFSSYIPDGLRAVSIPVNFYGDNSLIREGDKVDLISTYYTQGSGELFSETVISGKEIVFIKMGGSEYYSDSAGSDGNFLLGGAEGGDFTDAYHKNYITLTFYLTGAEAERVFLAASRGFLNMSICNSK